MSARKVGEARIEEGIDTDPVLQPIKLAKSPEDNKVQISPDSLYSV